MATDKLVDFDHVTDYISREAALDMCDDDYDRIRIRGLPAANVVQEENILKFYYVRSIDEYWIGRRLDNLYYARYESENQQWVWAYSRYLPWGEHVVSPTSLWKEHTYPSEPEEISFTDWLKGFSQKYVAADVRPVVLPCKVGDIVFLIVPGLSSPMPVPVCSLTWRDGKWSINADREETEPPKVVGFQIGKTAFLTREEAEAALRKEPDNG